jgi:hypothetical protein
MSTIKQKPVLPFIDYHCVLNMSIWDFNSGPVSKIVYQPALAKYSVHFPRVAEGIREQKNYRQGTKANSLLCRSKSPKM